MSHQSIYKVLQNRPALRIAAQCAAALMVMGASGVLTAQEAENPAAVPLPKGGFQIREVSGYAVYYSRSLPNGTPQAGAANLPSDLGIGGSTVFEWAKFTDRSTFSLTYTPSYTARLRFSSLDALNHMLSLTTSQKVAPRWTFNFSAAGNYSNFEQSLFAPTTLANVAAAPATFADLAAGILSGKFANNPQLGVILNGAPLVESPLRNLLYGERMLTASGQTSLVYSYSPRLSITFSGGAGRTQHVSGDQPVVTSNAYLIPDTTTASASVALTYSLSPLTNIGGSVTTNRTVSTFLDAYTTTSVATFGRTFKRRWLLQLHGGIGLTNPVRQAALGITTTPRPVLGGSLGFKTFSHTLLGAFDHTVTDAYGVGATSNSSATATWRWRRPANSWWLESSGGWQRLAGSSQSLLNTSAWNLSATLGRAVGSHLVLLTQYTYLAYAQVPQNGGYNISQSAIRLSLMWSPHPAAL